MHSSCINGEKKNETFNTNSKYLIKVLSCNRSHLENFPSLGLSAEKSREKDIEEEEKLKKKIAGMIQTIGMFVKNDIHKCLYA